jgi:branched-subunit amino acid aminotransferase/4-amino-4-deoxychorismate lyase
MYADVRATSEPAPLDAIVWGTAKHTSRAGHVVRLRRSGADEVLFHRDGRHTEGTWSAVLGVVDGALYSAESEVLPSIAAAAYRQYAREAGVPVVSEGPPVGCPALYVASSLRELCPVVELDGKALAGWDPVGMRLRALSVACAGD